VGGREVGLAVGGLAKEGVWAPPPVLHTLCGRSVSSIAACDSSVFLVQFCGPWRCAWVRGDHGVGCATSRTNWRHSLLHSPALGAIRTSLFEVGMPGCMCIAAVMTADMWPCQLLLHGGTLPCLRNLGGLPLTLRIRSCTAKLILALQPPQLALFR
jgi:hypothetical protein